MLEKYPPAPFPLRIRELSPSLEKARWQRTKLHSPLSKVLGLTRHQPHQHMREEALLKHGCILDHSAASGIDNLAAIIAKCLACFRLSPPSGDWQAANLPGSLEKLWVQKGAHWLPDTNISYCVLWLQQEPNLPHASQPWKEKENNTLQEGRT